MQGDAYPHPGCCTLPRRVPMGFHAERATGGGIMAQALHAGRYAHRGEGLAPPAL
jgi:hypothetical protein